MKTIIVILMLVASISLSSCSEQFFECEHEISEAKVSPDKTLIAALDNVGCGATSSFVTWLLVAPIDKELDPDMHVVAVFEGKVISLEWTGDREINVHGDADLSSSQLDTLGISLIHDSSKLERP